MGMLLRLILEEGHSLNIEGNLGGRSEGILRRSRLFLVLSIKGELGFNTWYLCVALGGNRSRRKMS